MDNNKTWQESTVVYGTEDILTSLANFSDLKVIARTSVNQYRDTKKPIRQIGAELGVAYVLEGSVRRAGTKIRVTGQLIEARTEGHVWAQHYTREFELKDVFGIQSELATEIVQALHVALSPQDKARLGQVPTQNPAAYVGRAPAMAAPEMASTMAIAVANSDMMLPIKERVV